MARLGHQDEALADYERVLKSQPQDQEVLWNRALALAQLKRFEEALADFDEVLSLRQNDPTAGAEVARQIMRVLWSQADEARQRGQLQDAITSLGDIIQRFSAWPGPKLTDLVAEAMMDKAKLLGKVKDPGELLATVSELDRYGQSRQVHLTVRSWLRAATLWRKKREGSGDP